MGLHVIFVKITRLSFDTSHFIDFLAFSKIFAVFSVFFPILGPWSRFGINKNSATGQRTSL